MTTVVLKRIIFHSCRKLKFLYKTGEYFFSTNSRLYDKKKFKIRNEFTFQDEFQQKLDKMYFEKGRLVSSELLLNTNKKKSQSEDKITPKKKPLKNLKSPLRYRGEILFGIHPVYLALSQKKRIFYNLYIRKEADLSFEKGISRKQEIIEKAESMNVPISDIDNRGLSILAPSAVHQGVCLDAGFLPVPIWNEEHSECQVSEEKMPLWIVLDEILDPMNVGAIIRSAYFFGVDKVLTVQGNSCKLSPTVSKASSGVLEVINIQQIENLEYFITNRKCNGWCIVSTLAYCEEKTDFRKPPISAADFSILKPTIFILGNEGRGISKNVLNLCDSLIFIEPGQSLHPRIDSLNVSVAAGILLYVLNNSKNVRR